MPLQCLPRIIGSRDPGKVLPGKLVATILKRRSYEVDLRALPEIGSAANCFAQDRIAILTSEAHRHGNHHDCSLAV